MECGCYLITPVNRDDLSNDMATGKLSKRSLISSWQLLTFRLPHTFLDRWLDCLCYIHVIAMQLSKNNQHLSPITGLKMNALNKTLITQRGPDSDGTTFRKLSRSHVVTKIVSIYWSAHRGLSWSWSWIIPYIIYINVVNTTYLMMWNVARALIN